MMLRQWLSTASLLALLAGCSPYSFSKETAAMNDGVGKLSDAFSAGYDGLSTDRANNNTVALLDAHATRPGREIGIPLACNRTVETDDTKTRLCGLFLKGTPEPTLTDVELTRAKTMAAIKKLKDYASALAAVTNAADRSAYDNAVAQLSGAVGAITTPLNVAAPGASVLASASINVVGWLFGTALDQQRYDSLRKAVTKVGDPVATKEDPSPESAIRVVTGVLGDGLLTLKGARLEILNAQAGALVDGLNTRRWSAEDYQKRLGDTQAVLAVINSLRNADPKGAADDLADAHDKLVLAVTDSNTNYTALLKAVADFGDKVAAVQAAMTAMSKAKKGS